MAPCDDKAPAPERAGWAEAQPILAITEPRGPAVLATDLGAEPGLLPVLDSATVAKDLAQTAEDPRTKADTGTVPNTIDDSKAETDVFKNTKTTKAEGAPLDVKVLLPYRAGWAEAQPTTVTIDRHTTFPLPGEFKSSPAIATHHHLHCLSPGWRSSNSRVRWRTGSARRRVWSYTNEERRASSPAR